MKKIIALDIDDVLADTTDLIRVIVNKRHALELEREHYAVAGEYWGYYEQVWRQHGLHEQLTLEDLHDELIASELSLPIVAGAQYAINELLNRYDVVFITSRDAVWMEPTKRWLRHHFQLHTPSIHFARNRWTHHHKSKGELCEELGAGYLIDDSPENCLSAQAHGVDAILFGEYGWHHQAPDHLIRCKDWPAVMEFFDAPPD
jgi:5'(3')-deoxyribonucleotidase